MGIGDFLAGAGDVGRGMRSAEQQAQLARMRQLQLQQFNRQQEADRLMTQGGTAGYGAPVGVPSYTMDAANQPAPPVAPGMSRAEMLAQARQTMSPEDLAVAFYSQQATGTQWQAAPAAPQQAGVAPSVPAVPDKIDEFGGLNRHLTEAEGIVPGAPGAGLLPPVGTAANPRRGGFRPERVAPEPVEASTPMNPSQRRRAQRSSGVTPPEAAVEEAAAQPETTDKRPVTDPMKNALRPPAKPAGVKPAKGQATAKAAPEVEAPSLFYAGNPKALTSARVALDDDYTRMRQRLLKQAQAYEKVGSGRQMNEVLGQLDMLDSQYRAAARLLEGNNALVMFEYGNDPRALDAILTDHLGGTPVQTQARADGKYDLFIGGKMQGEYGKADIASMVRELFDTNYREATVATKAEYHMKVFENQLAKDLKVTEIQAQALANATLEMIKGSINMQLVQVGNDKWRVTLDTNTNTAVFHNEATAEAYRMDLNSDLVQDGGLLGEIRVGPKMYPANIIGN